MENRNENSNQMRMYSKIGKNSFFAACVAVLLVSMATILLPAQSPEQLFEQANKFYIEKNYEKAISAYEQLIKTGSATPEIYYNIGNAYYKTDNYPAAILNYERAKKLKPSDEDIDFNLRLANLNTVDKIEPAPQVFYERWWNNFLNSTSIESHTKKGLLLVWIACVIAAVYFLVNNSTVKRITLFTALIVIFAGAFTLFLSYQQYKFMNDNRSAIIFSTSSYIKSSPDEKSINLFMLHAGTKVTVVDELQGWKRIRIANGNEGWITSNDLEII